MTDFTGLEGDAFSWHHYEGAEWRSLSSVNARYLLEGKVVPCMNDLMQVPPIVRLADVNQCFGVKSTLLSHRGEFFSHSRLLHCIDVFVELDGRAGTKVTAGEMTVDEAAAVIIAGFLHDIGVPAFSHVGEDIIRANGFKSFDHDLHTLVLASQDEIQEVLRRHLGDSAKEVLAVLGACFLLDDDGKQREETATQLKNMCEFLKKIGLPAMSPALQGILDDRKLLESRRVTSRLVQDFSDMFAYLSRDIEESPVDRVNAEDWAKRARESLQIGEGELILSSFEPFKKVVMILADKEGSSVLTNATALANAVLKHCLRKAGINTRHMIAGKDKEILSKFEEWEQEMFNRGVDEYYQEVISVPLRAGINPQPLLEHIERSCDRQKTPGTVAGVTPQFNKSFRFGLVDGALMEVKELKIPPEGLVLNRLDEAKYENDPVIVTIRQQIDENHIEIDMTGKRTIVVAVRRQKGRSVDIEKLTQSVLGTVAAYNCRPSDTRLAGGFPPVISLP